MSWWSDKLSGRKAQQHVPPRPMYSPTLPAPVQQQQQQPAEPQGLEQPAVGYAAAGTTDTYLKVKQRHEAASKCPECGSGNYHVRRPEGLPVINTETGAVAQPRPVCFDCGYPLLQSGSEGGLGGSSQAVKVKHGGVAPTPKSFTTGYHGDTVIARIE